MIFIILLIVMMVILSAMNRMLGIPFNIRHLLSVSQLMMGLPARKSAYYEKPLGTKCRLRLITPVCMLMVCTEADGGGRLGLPILVLQPGISYQEQRRLHTSHRRGFRKISWSLVRPAQHQAPGFFLFFFRLADWASYSSFLGMRASTSYTLM